MAKDEENKYICGSCGEFTNQYVYSEERDIDECPTCYDVNSQMFIGSTKKIIKTWRS